MTPKEKADELVSKFNQHTAQAITHYPNGKMVENKDEAKQCALIAVAEILFALKMDINSPTSASVKYWQKVKQEIEKL